MVSFIVVFYVLHSIFQINCETTLPMEIDFILAKS